MPEVTKTIFPCLPPTDTLTHSSTSLSFTYFSNFIDAVWGTTQWCNNTLKWHFEFVAQHWLWNSFQQLASKVKIRPTHDLSLYRWLWSPFVWWTIPWSLVIALTFSFHNSGRAGQSDVPGEGSELPDTLAPFHREGRCFSAQYFGRALNDEWRTQWRNDGVGINGLKAHGRSFPFPVAKP